MTKAEYAAYLETNHWKNLRRLRLEKSDYKCERCGSGFLLQVHHLRYRGIWDVLVDDLETVCRYCHEKEHGLVPNGRPIKPDISQLLKDVFNIPQPKPKQTFKAFGHSPEEVIEIKKLNRLKGNSAALIKEQEIWKAAIENSKTSTYY